MTKQLKLSTLLFAFLASASVMAHDKPGYTIDESTSAITRNNYGECWQNTYLEHKLQECGGEEKILTEEVISLSSNFLFSFDKSVLRQEAITTLNEIANKLKSLSLEDLESISIEGHTDFKGSADYNQRLSERRAVAVANYLAQVGVPANKITARGFGKSQERMSGECIEQTKGIANASKRRSALIACIEPDRRVDVRINAKKPVESYINSVPGKRK